MNVCVYGGGNIAHSLVAKISLTQPVTVVTRQPERWVRKMMCEQNGKIFESVFGIVATDDARVLAGADLIFVALPQHAIEEVMDRIILHVRSGSTVVFVPAPARIARYVESLALRGVRTIGFQRVPYIARIVEYGRNVKISGDREDHRIVASDSVEKDKWSEVCLPWFGGSIKYLSSFLALSFSNSNPLLHPSRLVVLFDDWRHKRYLHNPPFYGEWTDESSELYVTADREMRVVMSHYPIDMGTDYESVLDHYCVKTAAELTRKLRDIPSFKSILSPMVQTEEGWIPDFSSRYFTEDVQYGLAEMLRLADGVAARIPTMRALYEGVNKLNR